jgi:hypothetical protein
VRYAIAFGRFWYAFIVGDDWPVAVGVVVALGGTALLAHHGISAWWLTPLAVFLLLGTSVWRALSRARLARAQVSARRGSNG